MGQQEEKFTFKQFSQEVHPRKSGGVPVDEEDALGQDTGNMQLAPKPNSVAPGQGGRTQPKQGGLDSGDPMTAMLLPDPGAHDNQVYSGFNHCCGTCCMLFYCPCNVVCPDPRSVKKIEEGWVGVMTELGRFHSMLR